jgi:hypothetical protein
LLSFHLEDPDPNRPRLPASNPLSPKSHPNNFRSLIIPQRLFAGKVISLAWVAKLGQFSLKKSVFENYLSTLMSSEGFSSGQGPGVDRESNEQGRLVLGGGDGLI